MVSTSWGHCKNSKGGRLIVPLKTLNMCLKEGKSLRHSGHLLQKQRRRCHRRAKVIVQVTRTTQSSIRNVGKWCSYNKFIAALFIIAKYDTYSAPPTNGHICLTAPKGSCLLRMEVLQTSTELSSLYTSKRKIRV